MKRSIVVTGESGSGKSVLIETIKSMIEPGFTSEFLCNFGHSESVLEFHIEELIYESKQLIYLQEIGIDFFERLVLKYGSKVVFITETQDEVPVSNNYLIVKCIRK